MSIYSDNFVSPLLTDIESHASAGKLTSETNQEEAAGHSGDRSHSSFDASQARRAGTQTLPELARTPMAAGGTERIDQESLRPMNTASVNTASPDSLQPNLNDSFDQVWPVLGLELGGETVDQGPLIQVVEKGAKRLLDLFATVVGLVALSPFLLLIAFAIRIDSPGSILFRQRRLGRYGRPFWIYKFRSMEADAETQLTTLETRNEAARGVLFKMKNDPRVTTVGAFLRRTNLDELPQLINVLKGEMSLVGPRPFQMRDCERLMGLDPAGFRRRLTFPPGLTGAWQVGRSSPVDSEHLLELDLDYVDHWSFARDLRILYKTIFVVMQGFLAQDKKPRMVPAAPAGVSAPSA